MKYPFYDVPILFLISSVFNWYLPYTTWMRTLKFSNSNISRLMSDSDFSKAHSMKNKIFRKVWKNFIIFNTSKLLHLVSLMKYKHAIEIILLGILTFIRMKISEHRLICCTKNTVSLEVSIFVVRWVHLYHIILMLKEFS